MDKPHVEGVYVMVRMGGMGPSVCALCEVLQSVQCWFAGLGWVVLSVRRAHARRSKVISR